MDKKLSPTMQQLFDYVREHGAICRYPGGFWAKEGWQLYSGRYFGASSIEALVSRGILAYTKWQAGRSGSFPIEARLATIEGDRT